MGDGRGGLGDKCIWVPPNEVIWGRGRFEEGVRTEGDMRMLAPGGGEGRETRAHLDLVGKVRVRG